MHGPARLARCAALLLAVAVSGCGDEPPASPAGYGSPPGDFASIPSGGVDKLDLLLMVGDSPSMADKQAILAGAVPELVDRLVAPRCVDSTGAPTGHTTDVATGRCPPDESPEFAPVTDIHVGVITSSLGGAGSDACTDALPGYDSSMQRMAHLVTTGASGSVPTYAGKGFLQWDPRGVRSPPGDSEAGAFASTFAELVTGAGEAGCPFAQSLEAVYRFLIDPEPYASLSILNGLIMPDGTDQTLLQQRADFLRPDSLVLIVSLSDEDDCSVVASADYYLALQRRRGHTTFHLPHATSPCLANPNDVCCFSCGQSAPTGCADPTTDPECQRPPSTELDDPYPLRCFHQKQRFGIDFLYPVQRYIDGITKPTVPSRAGEAVSNPLFADLQCRDNTDCKPGRDPSLVFWAMLVGVPWQDIARDPKDLTKGYMTSDELASNGRWDVILGDPGASPPIDPTDPLMLASVTPRTGKNPVTNDPLVPPDGAAWNPINGHEWDTSKRGDHLQSACVFPFAGPPRDCAANPTACACDAAAIAGGNPLCAPMTGAAQTSYAALQYGAQAYPGTRHLEVAKGLGDQGIVASSCSASLTDPASSDYGYRPAIDAIVDRLAGKLKRRCLPRSLAPCHDGNDSCVQGVEEGQVPCVVLEVTTLPSPGATCDCSRPGHGTPPPEKITPEIRASRPNACVCEIVQLSGQDLASCQQQATLPQTTQDGWCYVDPAQGSGNPALVAKCLSSQQRTIRFVNSSGQTPASGSVVFYACQWGPAE